MCASAQSKLSACMYPADLLHTLSCQSPEGEWRNRCDGGPDGRRQGFTLAGRARPNATLEPADPGDFELTCTGRAQGECVRFGYRPRETRADGLRMLSLFNSCVRQARADYPGDGLGATRDGQLIDIHDALGIPGKANEVDLDFEAGWSPEGAVCVRHVRVKDKASLDALEASLPRLRGRTGAVCAEAFARSLGATLFNRSPN